MLFLATTKFRLTISSSCLLLYIIFLISLFCNAEDLDLSSAEVVRHRLSSRPKRQAYPVFSASEGRVTLDSSGQTESGPWEEWQTSAECSRTCGGGVKIENRKCGGTGCVGPNKRYISCNVEPCEDTSADYRAEQCSTYNDKPLEGKYHKWKPYTKASNKCELICMPEDVYFYFKWADKVADGTKCDEFSDDMCVDGICLPVGCDGQLGSLVKADKCGVCGGDGKSCKTMRGLFDERHVAPGYVDITTIPTGASSIVIEETHATNNYLALRNESGHYFLNGRYKIDFPTTLHFAGTIFEYDRNRLGLANQEKITARGPTTEPVILVLLNQADHTAITYEYTLPLDETLQYQYVVGPWSECSVTCGKGLQTREATCVERANNQPVADESLCANASQPALNRSCGAVDCQSQWFIGDWEPCSSSCGSSGLQFRQVYCHRLGADGTRQAVDDTQCADDGERPPIKQPCSRFSCPDWQAGPWSACSKACGSALQYRAVTCRSEKAGEEGKLLPSKHCNESAKFDDQRTCNLGPCEGLRWVASDWILCSKCNDTTEYRNVTCEDANGRRYPEDKCKDQRPDDSRSCVTVIPCAYKWQSSQWSDCSSQCGHGHQSRTVYCTLDEGGFLKKMDEAMCDPNLKPENRQNCTHEGSLCTGTYYSSPWSNCTAECGGGIQTRTALCFDYNFQLRPDMCDEDEKPDESQDCNLEPCVVCNETEHGCCPDGVTPAVGPYLEGCSNCSESEFGCCPDNITVAADEDFQQCPLDTSLTTTTEAEVEASGDGDVDAVSTTTIETVTAECDLETDTECLAYEEEFCNYTNAAGVSVQIPCVNLTVNESLSLNDTDLLFGNETSENATTEIHCSKTEFGCCPDWYTPANGTDFLECPLFEIGNCNGTKFGCCPDDLTLSRGPNFEGCGDAGCAASLFGCCKDRMTIAFGTHYSGCERANQPCEASTFGCCSDGQTAALGRNGEGCEEDCRLTHFGCCPDGKTASKGVDNEGCGCSSARFGCCPDGTSSAQGANFQGCPETCARSFYGCCPDGKTQAQGPHNEGCPCVFTEHGCCPDGETPSRGPNFELCDDCRYWKYGCCADGKTKALGPNRQGCDLTPEARKSTAGALQPGQTVSPSKIAACTLPRADTQVCADYVLMWYYDASEGACRQFWYGGCEGNENQFSTEQECRSVCVEPAGIGVCYLPKIEGPQDCGVVEVRWYYDLASSQCQAFYYNGCNGNSNNFRDYDDCMHACQSVRTQVPPSAEHPAYPQTYPQPPQPQTYPASQTSRPESDANQICALPVEHGECSEQVGRWHFEASSRRCLMFTYSGCGGNDNNFDTEAACQQTCQAPPEPEEGGKEDDQNTDVCFMSKDSGPCDNFVPKWFFNAADGTCGRFYYGGCHGNKNRFDSLEVCEAACSNKLDPCVLPPVQGPCSGTSTRWHFDAKSRQCQTFTYGGCLGNANRFESKQQCSARCGASDQLRLRPGQLPFYTEVTTRRSTLAAGDLCRLTVDPGDCQDYHYRYYFNWNNKRCEAFIYTGCGGNDNRFDRQETCESMCGLYGVRNVQADFLTPSVEGDDSARSRDRPIFESLQHGVAYTEPATTSNSVLRSMTTTTTTRASEITRQDGTEMDGHDADNICHLLFDVGPCKNLTTRWYFDVSSKRCQTFQYGGCLGNSNNFETSQICREYCMDEHHDIDVALGGEPVDNTLEDRLVPAGFYPAPTSELPDMCKQPSDPGDCYESLLRYYYDSEKQKCQSFQYTNCKGNTNRFFSMEECDRACGDYRDPGVCSLPADPGHCPASVMKWHWNGAKAACESFVYGGCGGNGNRFGSREECESLCRKETESMPSDICQLHSEPGPCQNFAERYYFDLSSGVCNVFTYGGCQGNENNFENLAACQLRCGKTASSGNDFCHLSYDSGPCQEAITQYFYDAPSGLCKPFTYGGCRGNKNRFNSKQHCENTCQMSQKSAAMDKNYTICSMPRDSGPCTDPQVIRFYFEATTRRCEPFIYGGCLGNDNRFFTEQECQDMCQPADRYQMLTETERPQTWTAVTEKIATLQATYDYYSTLDGQVLNLHCRIEHASEQTAAIFWYKNDKRFDLRKNAKLLANSTLHISPASSIDSGYYTCGIMHATQAVKSNVVHVQIKDTHKEGKHPPCFDDPTKANCELVKTAGLCDHSFYGKNCCQTCRKASEFKRAKRLKWRARL